MIKYMNHHKVARLVSLLRVAQRVVFCSAGSRDCMEVSAYNTDKMNIKQSSDDYGINIFTGPRYPLVNSHPKKYSAAMY